MKIVVTGATGFVGRPLVRELIDRGHEVVALSRDPRAAAKKLPIRTTCVGWDLAAGPLDPKLLAGVDAVVHLAGEGVADGRWTDARKQAIRESRVGSSRMLVDAIRQLPENERPKAFVAASAIGFYGDRDDEALTETSTAGSGFLAEVCQAWEAETRHAEELGLRWAAVRIGLVLGKDGGALAKMLPPFQFGVGGRLGSGLHWMSWIHLRDLVRLFAHAVENPTVSGILNGVAPEPVRNSHFTTVLGRVLHRPTIFPVPQAVLQLALGEMSSLLFSSQRLSPEITRASGFTYEFPDIETALSDLLDGIHTIDSEEWVDRPLDEVFSFFSDPYNLEKITPEFLNFHVVGTSSASMTEGMTIDYKLSLHGLPMKWRSRIEEWEPGRGFVDVQVNGPYQLWHHSHRFEEFNGGTLVRDRVLYKLPLGVLGDTFGGPFVRSDVAKIFEFRRQKIQEIFGHDGEPSAKNSPRI